MSTALMILLLVACGVLGYMVAEQRQENVLLKAQLDAKRQEAAALRSSAHAALVERAALVARADSFARMVAALEARGPIQKQHHEDESLRVDTAGSAALRDLLTRPMP